MKFIIAKKLGMTQVFDPEGKVHPVTLLKAGPATVTQVKTKEKDGYEALQVKFGSVKSEFRFEGAGEKFKIGDRIDVSQFEKGSRVKIVGTSKGRGFAGVVKRHGFGGHPASHGTKHAHREPGSIGATHPQHVIKGRRMAGHMGSRRVTASNLKIVEVDPEKNLMAVEGGVPGAIGSILTIRQ